MAGKLGGELEAAVEAVRRAPRDPTAWRGLARALGRRGGAGAPDVFRAGSDGLLAAWKESPGDPDLADLVLGARGLSPRDPGPVPEFWVRTGRAAGRGEACRDRVTGLRLAATRRVDGAPMVLVPAGPFLRGSNANTFREGPVRTLVLGTFYADRHPVTVARYARFLGATGREPPPEWAEQESGPDRPVAMVTWHEATAYAAWAGGALPTEAEWERLARGADGRTYPWGDDPTGALEPGHGAYGRGAEVWRREPVEIGTYPWTVSPMGVLDLAGMMRDWCADWYQDGYYATAPERDPAGPADGGGKVLRGGSWHQPGWVATASHRFADVPSMRSSAYGFRCVVRVPG